ncbi:hypothetical protein AcW1_006083 [Taiwanofungus camphoratus]|nr:hypothetical protein AcW2_004845 [Antrodia cinnamomea]KAI0934621.1 hypothetical protein AcV5_006404 [Antrodia cinnamomea]KAI0950096.1 hypothetical protein AcV7_008664 [Antrodia cinnamomea]KAI0957809.1 hypothetical protein AcW1_006083 [Antrodia cinnamomea]
MVVGPTSTHNLQQRLRSHYVCLIFCARHEIMQVRQSKHVLSQLSTVICMWICRRVDYLLCPLPEDNSFTQTWIVISLFRWSKQYQYFLHAEGLCT